MPKQKKSLFPNIVKTSQYFVDQCNVLPRYLRPAQRREHPGHLLARDAAVAAGVERLEDEPDEVLGLGPVVRVERHVGGGGGGAQAMVLVIFVVVVQWPADCSDRSPGPA